MTFAGLCSWYTCVVAILLALGSGLVHGVSDYLGGRAGRRFAPVVVTLIAELSLFAIS